MLNSIFISSLLSLKNYCEKENFQGWDPFDGLNSKIFQATPLKKWDLARLAWIQFFKRSPVNFRRLFLVPKEYNAKGVALFLTGYCNLYRYQQQTGKSQFGNAEELSGKIHLLSELLIKLQSKGYSGACWGYNFDWQARRLFLFPKNTPTVVATSFCATSLLDAYELTKEQKYLDIALSSADFILNDLNRTQKGNGFLFSYSPVEGNNTVYNASLLGSKLLSQCYSYTKNEEYKIAARLSVEACIEAQNEDGSWFYGELPVQNWIDSFHTGYSLDSLNAYQTYSGDNTYKTAIAKGFEFYIKNFFTEYGIPKYYHNKTYPIDIHCPVQLIVTLSRLNKFKEHKVLVEKVMHWTIRNMQNKKGYFYYQIRKGFSSKIPYMRWCNAFMFYAMSYYLLEEISDE
jgi:rhamnogalacturonyl hydrolase YesR